MITWNFGWTCGILGVPHRFLYEARYVFIKVPSDVRMINQAKFEQILPHLPYSVNLQDTIDRKTTRRKDAIKYKECA